MRKKVDIDAWERKMVYKNFIAYTHPTFSLSAFVDVTDLVGYCKGNGKSFFACFLYVLSRALNNVDAFRLRIQDGEVFLYDRIHPNYIVMKDDQTIATCRTEMREDFNAFYDKARKDIETVKRAGEDEPFNKSNENNVFYISCLPWLDFHSVSNPYDFTNHEQTSIPRITWGKYIEKDNRLQMLVDISVHHALMDGKMVADAFLELRKMLSTIENILR